MPSKREVLSHLTRDELFEVAMLASVEVSRDGQDVEQLTGKTVLNRLLKHWPLERLKGLCASVGVSQEGDDRTQLVEGLFWTGSTDTSTEARSFAPPIRKNGVRASSSRTVVQSLVERDQLRIDFPNVVGFAVSKEALRCDVAKVAPIDVKPAKRRADVAWTPAGWVETVGEHANLQTERVSRAAFYARFPVEESVNWIAQYIVAILSGHRTRLPNQPTTPIRVKAPQVLLRDARAIVDDYVHVRLKKVFAPGSLEDIALGRNRDAIIDRLVAAIVVDEDGASPSLIPVLDEYRPSQSTSEVRFTTKMPIFETTKSHVSHVVLEEKWDKRWDESAACYLEESANVVAYTKNDQPHFGIHYESDGVSRLYAPDYLIRIPGATWVVEIEWQRIPTGDEEIAWRATSKWIRAVNNHGGYGYWKHVVCRTPEELKKLVDAPSPPITRDGSEVTWWQDRRPEVEREWWERDRVVAQSARQRKKPRTWHISGEIKWFIPPPTKGEERPKASDGHSWLVPCRCKSTGCDGVRTVSESNQGVRLIGMHLLDFVAHLEQTEGWRSTLAKENGGGTDKAPAPRRRRKVRPTAKP